MRCRHTVPDWHRYVAAGEVTRPVLAACRLLIKAGEPAADARTIACSFWGHQRDCPVYDGPGARPTGVSSPVGRTDVDTPAASEDVWPVRQPGATDGQRLTLMALGGLSVALLGWAAVLGTVALAGGGFIAEAKGLPGVEVISLSRENRDRLPPEIAARLAGAGRGGA